MLSATTSVIVILISLSILDIFNLSPIPLSTILLIRDSGFINLNNSTSGFLSANTVPTDKTKITAAMKNTLKGLLFFFTPEIFIFDALSLTLFIKFSGTFTSSLFSLISLIKFLSSNNSVLHSEQLSRWLSIFSFSSAFKFPSK